MEHAGISAILREAFGLLFFDFGQKAKKRRAFVNIGVAKSKMGSCYFVYFTGIIIPYRASVMAPSRSPAD